jgi:hypothetical protein
MSDGEDLEPDDELSDPEDGVHAVSIQKALCDFGNMLDPSQHQLMVHANFPRVSETCAAFSPDSLSRITL